MTSPAPLQGSGIKVLNMVGIKGWTRSQVYALQPLQLKRIYHSMDFEDTFLERAVPKTEFVRVESL